MPANEYFPQGGILMTNHRIEIAMRIPGPWADEKMLVQAISSDCKLSGNSLVLANGSQVQLYVRPRDSQFADVFKTSCRRKPSGQELERVQNYRLQVCLVGSGGSMESAAAMMRSALPFLKAGGAGVFVDNSALSFGASHWSEMAEFCDADALTFSLVNIIRGNQDIYTVGMHVLGQPDLIMPIKSAGDEGSLIIDLMLKIATSGRTIEDGGQIELPNGQAFRVRKIPDEDFQAGLPMHNPWGRLQLSSDRNQRSAHKN